MTDRLLIPGVGPIALALAGALALHGSVVAADDQRSVDATAAAWAETFSDDEGGEVTVLHLRDDHPSGLAAVAMGLGPDGERGVGFADRDGAQIVVSSGPDELLPSSIAVTDGPRGEVLWVDDDADTPSPSIRFRDAATGEALTDWFPVTLDEAGRTDVTALVGGRTGAEPGTSVDRSAATDPPLPNEPLADDERQSYDVNVPFQINAVLAPAATDVQILRARCAPPEPGRTASCSGGLQVENLLGGGIGSVDALEAQGVVLQATLGLTLSTGERAVRDAGKAACKDRGDVEAEAFYADLAEQLVGLAGAALGSMTSAAAAPATGGWSLAGTIVGGAATARGVYKLADDFANLKGVPCNARGAIGLGTSRLLSQPTGLTVEICAISELGRGCGEAEVPPPSGRAPTLAPSTLFEYAEGYVTSLISGALGRAWLTSWVEVPIDYRSVVWHLAEPYPVDLHIETPLEHKGALTVAGQFTLDHRAELADGPVRHSLEGSFTPPPPRMEGGDVLDMSVSLTGSGSGSQRMDLSLCYSADIAFLTESTHDDHCDKVSLLAGQGKDAIGQPPASFTYEVPAIAEPGTRIWLKVNAGPFGSIVWWYEAALE